MCIDSTGDPSNTDKQDIVYFDYPCTDITLLIEFGDMHLYITSVCAAFEASLLYSWFALICTENSSVKK